MSYWQEIATTHFPDESFQSASEVYYRLSRQYIDGVMSAKLETSESLSPEEEERLRTLGSKSLDHAYGHMAYELGYEAFMTDVSNNDTAELQALVDKTFSTDDTA